MTDRKLLANAWQEGWLAGRQGKPQAANPYIAKNAALAKEWDIGWKEGSGVHR